MARPPALSYQGLLPVKYYSLRRNSLRVICLVKSRNIDRKLICRNCSIPKQVEVAVRGNGRRNSGHRRRNLRQTPSSLVARSVLLPHLDALDSGIELGTAFALSVAAGQLNNLDELMLVVKYSF